MLPPGPRLPRALQLAEWILRPQEYMEKCAAKFGDCFTIRLLNNPVVVLIRDPSTIKKIFTGNASVLHAGETAKILQPLLGAHSLLLLDGSRHLRERRLMLPPFHGARMKSYAESMQQATQVVVNRWQDGGEVNLQHDFQMLTLDIIMRTVFGIEDMDAMRELGQELIGVLSFADNAPALLPFLPGGKKARAALNAQIARSDKFILEEIEDRRRHERYGHDVLSLLMTAKDDDGQKLSDQELRDQLMTLLVAGHETTASALGWTIECLLSRRTTYEALRAELDRVLGGRLPTPDDYANLPYLEATIRESLRLRPIVPLVARRLQVPMTVRGYDLPAGTAVGLSIYLTHRHPKIYTDPERFQPERFLAKRPDPYEWLPFGGGIRRCLGQAFALYEMKIVLATVLSQVDLDLCPGNSARMARRAITFSPSGGPRVRVSRPRAAA